MHCESNIWLTFFWWAVFSTSENLTLTKASRSKAATPPAEALAPLSRLFLTPPRPPLICLAFFPVVFLIALSPIFLRGEAFFTAAVFFLDFPAWVFRFFVAGVFKAFMGGDFRVFRIGDFRPFRFAAFEALAEVAGAFNTVFLIPGFAMEIFLAPALADFLAASEFGATMVLMSCLFAGQWDTERDFIEIDKISLIDNIVFVLNFPVVFSTCLKYIPH